MSDETMPPVGMSGTGSWYPDDNTTVTFEFRNGTGGLEVTSFKAWRHDASAMPPKLQRRIGSELQRVAELWLSVHWDRYRRRKELGAGTLRVGEGEDQVAIQLQDAVITPPPDPKGVGDVVTDATARRRRRGSLGDEDRLRKTAGAYNGTRTNRLLAVANALDVSKPQASRYIKAAKDAGLIEE